MASLPCLQCGRWSERTSRAFLTSDRRDYHHYLPLICNDCYDVFESMLDAVSPMEDPYAAGDQLSLRMDTVA